MTVPSADVTFSVIDVSSSSGPYAVPTYGDDRGRTSPPTNSAGNFGEPAGEVAALRVGGRQRQRLAVRRRGLGPAAEPAQQVGAGGGQQVGAGQLAAGRQPRPDRQAPRRALGPPAPP